jgi:hypothetical protein
MKIQLFAQNPTIEWQKSLGGSSLDTPYSIIETTDGAYIIAGSVYSNDGDVIGNHGNVDIWIVKLNVNGNIIWQRSLGGSGIEEAFSIIETTNGGYIVAGYSSSSDGDVSTNYGNEDVWVIKLDANGNMLWQKSIGGTGNERAYSIQQTTNGGYIVAGYTNSNDGVVSGNHGYSEDYWVIKLDFSGNIEWKKCFGGTQQEYATSIQQTSDNGFIVVGQSTSNDGDLINNQGYQDGWIVKLDAIGNIVWKKSLGGMADEWFTSVIQLPSGEYLVAGYTNSNDGDIAGNHGDTDAWIIKLDELGNIIWNKCIGDGTLNTLNSLQRTSDVGFVFSGHSYNLAGSNQPEFWVVKMDTHGNIIWQSYYGGSEDEFAHSIQQTSDSGYIVCGWSNSTDGDVNGNHGNMDYWVVKLSSESGMEEIVDSELKITPNPCNGDFTIVLNKEIDVKNYYLFDYQE